MSKALTSKQLYRRLYRELSFQAYEAGLIQHAEREMKAKALAAYKKQEYKPTQSTTASKRLAVCPLYDSTGLRQLFEQNNDLNYGKEVLDYLKAQRTYKELFARYNGKDFEDEERLRLTAHRVGFELPA